MRRVWITIVAVAAAWQLPGAARAVAPPANEPPSYEGSVVLTDAESPDRVLSSGDSNTQFLIRVPADASCPGDSQNDNYLVQTFVVPSGTDIGSVRYRDIGPIGENHVALFTASADQSSMSNIVLDANSAAGQPGRIRQLPPATFYPFPAGTLAPGDYEIGIACTYFVHTSRYWHTQINIAADPSVQPGEFTWTLTGTPPPDAGGSASGSRTLWIAGLAALGLAAGAYLVVGGRGRRTRAVADAEAETLTTLKESS
jgi:hypothetical protein